METTPELGNYIRMIRRELGYRQSDVARQSGISVSYMSEIEKGKMPRLVVLAELVRVLHLSPDELYMMMEMIRERNDEYEYEC